MSTVAPTRKRQKTGGRVAGTPNKVTAEFRETVRRLLEDNADNLGRWLQEVAEGAHGQPDPGKAIDLMAKLAEFAAPKLGRVEHTGAGGGPVQMGVILEIKGVPASG
jgi:hypothetical protein